MEFSALDQERRVPGLGGGLRPEGPGAARGGPAAAVTNIAAFVAFFITVTSL